MSHDPERAPDAEEAGRQLARSFRKALEAAEAEAPSFEDVASYVEGRLLGDERLLFEERLAGDPLLRAEVQDLRALRAEMAQARSARTSWVGWAAAAGLVAALGAGLLWMRGGAKPVEQAGTTLPTPEAPPAIAQLLDQVGPLSLRANGSVTGVRVPAGLESSLAEALRSGQVRVPAPRADLAVAPVTAMGPAGDAAPFGPVQPLSTLVRSDRPTLRFTPHPRATGYVVSIYDLDLEKVAASGTLHATEWTPDRPLRRGRTYLWQIEARTPEGRVAAPAPPAAEARFHVATADVVAPLDEVVRTGSLLAAGVALAEAGFAQEAAEQFEQLVALNPESAEAKKLLEISRASRPRR
jgi:hypothetical protein